MLDRGDRNEGIEHEGLTTSPSILHWRLVETKLSWGVLFLIGGGFALADGFSVSGLSDYIGGKVIEEVSQKSFSLSDNIKNSHRKGNLNIL